MKNPQTENTINYEAEQDFIKLFNDSEPEDIYI